jgi:hypothetical protein
MKPSIIQAAYGSVPATLAPTVKRTRDYATAHGWGYELRELSAIEGPRARCTASDVLRFEILATIPGAIWCDMDCEPLAGFDHLDDDRPHMGFFPAVVSVESIPQPDTFLAYGPCEWWQKQLDAARKRGMTGVYCWPRKLLRDNPDAVQIPHEQYVHGMVTSSSGRKIDPVTGKMTKQPKPKGEEA